ncbi:MAG: hypothetical protein HN929_12935, partial [Chloroflexi bacterium]|nr:hypothetical protein [Chloroflexota bacterium]
LYVVTSDLTDTLAASGASVKGYASSTTVPDAGLVFDFVDGGAGLDSIVRSDGLNWNTDSGFTGGQYITVFGTQDNDGVYQIDSIGGTGGNTLIIVDADFTDASSVSGVTVTGFTASASAPVTDQAFQIEFMQNAGSDSILRNDVDWLIDGFYAGQFINITEAGANNNIYEIESLSGKELFVIGPALTNAANGSEVLVTGYDEAASVKDLDLVIDFIHDPNGSDYIVRNDGGDWEEDGFFAGQNITVTGSTNNNARFTIKSIDGDILFLETETQSPDIKTELKNEFSVVGISIESDAGQVTVTANNSSVVVTTSLSGSPPLLEMKDGGGGNDTEKRSFSDKALGGQKVGVQDPGKVAMNGTFSLVDIDNITTAHIDGGFIVDTGTNLDVIADDSTYLINGSTAFAYAGDIGGAGNIAINTVDRNTTAEIGNELIDPAGEVFITNAGDVTVNAFNSGGLVSVATSGVLQQSMDKKPAQQDEARMGRQQSNSLTAQDKAAMEKENARKEKETEKQNKSWIPTWMPEMSLSGNVSYNQIDDITTAAIFKGVVLSADTVDVKSLNDSWIGAYAGSVSITASYYDNSVKQDPPPQPTPPPPVKKVNDTIVRPVPTVKLLPNKQLWLAFSGKCAYWNTGTSGADAGSPDKKVEGGDKDINITEFFTRPTSASPKTTTKTFTLAVGDYEPDAVRRKKAWFTVTVEGKTYTGTDDEIGKAWVADIQKAIKSAIAAKKGVKKSATESATTPPTPTTPTDSSNTPGNEDYPKNKPVIAGAGSVSVTVNNIGGETRAFIDNSLLYITGSLNVEADTSQVIVGVATSGSVAYTQNNSGFGVAGSGSVNIITGLTEAFVNETTVISAVGGGGISISASDNNIIGAASGSMSVTVSTNDKKPASGTTDSSGSGSGSEKATGTSSNNTKTQAAVSVSPSAAISVVDSTVHAYASDSTLITDGDINVSATSNE